MKKVLFVLMLSMIFGWYGCTGEQTEQISGIGVVFDGTPLIIDPSVIYQGTSVGQVEASQWNNGVTRLTISLDKADQALHRSNLAVVVCNGRLHVVPLSGFGEPLPPSACMLGFENNTSFHWFKFKNLINNINMAARRRAQWLSDLSGLSG